VLTRPDNRYTVLAHQSADTTMTYLQAKLFQLFCHPHSAITVMALRKLISNMRQQNHVCSLILTDRSRAVSSITTGTDIHNLTEPLDGNLILVPFDKLKPYGFCFAKNTVAFL
jgi:hypothetical protein